MRNYAAYSLFVSIFIGCSGYSEESGSVNSAVGIDDEPGIETALDSPENGYGSLLDSPLGGALEETSMPDSPESGYGGLLDSPFGGASDERSTFSGRSEAGHGDVPLFSLSDNGDCDYTAPVVGSFWQLDDGRGQTHTDQCDPHFGGVPPMSRTLSTMSFSSKPESGFDDLSGFGIVYSERGTAVDQWPQVASARGCSSESRSVNVPPQMEQDATAWLAQLQAEGICITGFKLDDGGEQWASDTAIGDVSLGADTLAAAFVKTESGDHVEEEKRIDPGSQKNRKRRGGPDEEATAPTADPLQDGAQASKKRTIGGKKRKVTSDREVVRAKEYTVDPDNDLVELVHVEQRWTVTYVDDDGKARPLPMVTIVDAQHNRATLVRGPDLARVVERPSNTSRMFGKYASPSQKIMFWDYHSSDQSFKRVVRVPTPANYLTVEGVKEFLKHNKLQKNLKYSNFIREKLLAGAFVNGPEAAAR